MAKERKPVRRPYERIKRTVVNNGGRRSTSVILGITVHTTEGHDRPGLSDLEGLGDYFDRPSVKASSSVGIDGEGHSARYVPDGRVPWTQAAFNRVMLSIEQIGFSRFPRPYWLRKRDPQLRKTAKYIAYWSDKYDIPIQRGKVRDGVIVKPGVFRHSQLGAAGGNHGDPGPGYPMHAVLRMARYYKKNGW